MLHGLVRVLSGHPQGSPVFLRAREPRPAGSAQTALYHILLMLVQDMAPVLSFTAEEVFRHIPEALHPGAKSVFAFQLMDADAFLLDDADRKRWEAVLAARTEVTRATSRSARPEPWATRWTPP